MSDASKDPDTSESRRGAAAHNGGTKRRRPRPAFLALLVLVIASSGYYTLYYNRQNNELRDYYLRTLLVAASNADTEIERLFQNVNNFDLVDLNQIPGLFKSERQHLRGADLERKRRGSRYRQYEELG